MERLQRNDTNIPAFLGGSPTQFVTPNAPREIGAHISFRYERASQASPIREMQKDHTLGVWRDTLLAILQAQ